MCIRDQVLNRAVFLWMSTAILAVFPLTAICVSSICIFAFFGYYYCPDSYPAPTLRPTSHLLIIPITQVNDSAWTTLKFATVARKQQVTNVTMTSLARLANAVVADPRDAFTKLRYVGVTDD
jgi:hypothetical protein